MTQTPGMTQTLDARISNVHCAMQIALTPIEEALNGIGDKNAAAYAMYQLQEEIEQLHAAFAAITDNHPNQ